MKSCSCDICLLTANLSISTEASGWLLGSSEEGFDLCPECYDNVLNFVVGIRIKYIKRKRREHDRINTAPVISLVH